MNQIGTIEDKIKKGEARVGIVGLGYVGLPLAVEFATAGVPVVGFDLLPSKVEALRRGGLRRDVLDQGAARR